MLAHLENKVNAHFSWGCYVSVPTVWIGIGESSRK